VAVWLDDGNRFGSASCARAPNPVFAGWILVALSPDRLWRWNGQAWVPAGAPPAARPNTGLAVGVTVAVFVGVLILATVLTVVVLLTMGNQISNVFSNVAAALQSP
jgi:Flp pilus assembly pilin Flp